jgi:hypothetical protein
LLDEPLEVWLSLSVAVLSPLFFFDLLFEVLSLAWSLDELGVEEALEELLGVLDEEPDVPLFIEDEPLVPDVDAAPLYCDEELDDGLCVLPLL